MFSSSIDVSTLAHSHQALMCVRWHVLIKLCCLYSGMFSSSSDVRMVACSCYVLLFLFFDPTGKDQRSTNDHDGQGQGFTANPTAQDQRSTADPTVQGQRFTANPTAQGQRSTTDPNGQSQRSTAEIVSCCMVFLAAKQRKANERKTEKQNSHPSQVITYGRAEKTGFYH